MNEIVCIQLGTHSGMEPQGVPSLAARSLEHWEEGHHNMPRKGICKGIVVKGIKDVARDKSAIENHGHCRSARDDKLSIKKTSHQKHILSLCAEKLHMRCRGGCQI